MTAAKDASISQCSNKWGGGHEETLNLLQPGFSTASRVLFFNGVSKSQPAEIRVLTCRFPHIRTPLYLSLIKLLPSPYFLPQRKSFKKGLHLLFFLFTVTKYLVSSNLGMELFGFTALHGKGDLVGSVAVEAWGWSSSPDIR